MAFKIPQLYLQVQSPGHLPLLPLLAETRQHPEGEGDPACTVGHTLPWRGSDAAPGHRGLEAEAVCPRLWCTSGTRVCQLSLFSNVSVLHFWLFCPLALQSFLSDVNPPIGSWIRQVRRGCFILPAFCPPGLPRGCNHCQFHSLTSDEFPLLVRKSGRKHQAHGTSPSCADETESF